MKGSRSLRTSGAFPPGGRFLLAMMVGCLAGTAAARPLPPFDADGVKAAGLAEAVTVSWTDTCPACAWRVSTRSDGGPWVVQRQLAAGATGAVIDNLLPDRNYDVRLEAQGAGRWFERAVLTARTRALPAGPLAYGAIEARLRRLVADPSQPCSATCASAVTGIIASLIPAAAPVLGAISIVESLIAGSEVEQQINEINAELAQQQAQIDNIQQTLDLLQNEFYQYVQDQAQQATDSWSYLYQKSLDGIQGPDGTYLQFLTKIGVPTTGKSAGVWPSGTTYASIAANAAMMTGLGAFASDQTTAFLGYLQDLSTAVVTVGCTQCYRSVTQTTLAGAGSNNAATMQVYDALYQQMQTYVPVSGMQSANNLAAVFESYNNALMAIYQQNIAALQLAYTVEATINYLNYVNGQNNAGATQIPGIEDIPEISYAFGNGDVLSEQQRLTSAQVNLALLYAARINQLYNTTLQYIVSDPPVASYVWPTPPVFAQSEVNDYVQNHPYSKLIGQTRPTASVVGSPGGQAVPKLVGNSAFFYQYDGLNQVYQCVHNLLQNPTQALDATTCPPLFGKGTGATWDGVHFSAYAEVAGSVQLLPAANVVQRGCMVFGVWWTPGWPGRLQCNPAPAQPPLLAGGASNNSVTAFFDHSDPHAYYYFIDQTGSTLLATAQSKGSGLALVNGKYQVATTSTLQDAAEYKLGGWFSGTFAYTGPNGYRGEFVVGGTGLQGSGTNIDWTMPLNCTEDPTYCYVTASGICLGGNAIALANWSHDGNSVTLQNAGACAVPSAAVSFGAAGRPAVATALSPAPRTAR